MTPNEPGDAPRSDGGGLDIESILSEQARHQVQVLRRRMPRWIPWIFEAGFVVSLTGLFVFARESWALGSLRFAVLVYGGFTALFGWAVIVHFCWPRLIRPRIVPYFAREVGEFDGQAMAAFRRGRGLRVEAAALERLASTLGVKPLSAFGFDDDYHEQEVRWHPAREGLATAQALRAGLDARLLTAPDVAANLDALAVALRAAAEKGVDFSLVLRLHAKDSLQMVRTREVRQGSFW